MVKADISRDYYADLELQASATEADIKKQFKKLALKYHPDRNPGREAEVNAKFQTINTAHEVLTDPDQKAKYDSARARNSTSRSYAGYGGTTTTASGTRGNPWSSAGSQWAPPPKPPQPRKQPPPASAGAQRYANFANYATPNSTPPKANQDAEARRKNWEAWENMKPTTRPWQPPKPVPKEFTPQSGREESNNARYPPPPKSSKPGFEEFRAGNSPRAERTSPSRASSANVAPRRNGFMPATPGGDEPPASNTSAYSTFRTGRAPGEKKPGPPQPPPRAAPPPDPLRQFREQVGTPYEPRLSTPYATQGGEKTNPFESVNLNRSKSTRVPADRTYQPRAEPSKNSGSYERHRSASPPSARHRHHLSPEPGIARADSEINLGTSPKRTFSHANRNFGRNEPSRAQQKSTVEDNTSSDGGDSDSDIKQQSFGRRSRTFAKRRNPQSTGRAQGAPGPSGKPDNVNDGPQSGHNTASNGLNNGKQDGPSMYAPPKQLHFPLHSSTRKVSALPTVVEEPYILSSKAQLPPDPFSFIAAIKRHSNTTSLPTSHNPLPHAPSGEPYQVTPPHVLTPFEATQFKLVDELVTQSNQSKKLAKPSCGSIPATHSSVHDVPDKCGANPQVRRVQRAPESAQCSFNIPSSVNLSSPAFSKYRSSDEMGSPFKKYRFNDVSIPLQDQPRNRHFVKRFSKNANTSFANSFSFNVGSKTFDSSHSTQPAFTKSDTEKISTTFSPDDWHGKFEAGDYFAGNATGPKGASRAQSGDRTRTKSPVKGRPTTRSQTNLGSSTAFPSNIDPEILQQTTDSEGPMSPGGTKFTAEEWARTFSPQVFAPPPYPSAPSTRPASRPRRTRTGSSTSRVPKTHMTAGTAAMAAETSSDDSILEMGSRRTKTNSHPLATQSATATSTDSPNAMDIDPPSDQQPEPALSSRGGGVVGEETSSEARNVPLAPLRQDWRSGDANGTDVTAPPTNSQKPDLPRRSVDGKTFRRRPTKSWDEEDFKTTLEDLKNVEPLHHPATGLHSFNDLTSNLPFPSQAASKLTIPHDFSSGELTLPHPPRAPMVPRIAEGAIRPTPSSWESYLLAFKAYMADWDIFNTKIIMHFVARRNQLDGMKNGWLEAFGNSDLDKYREGLREDHKVREWWAVACEKHETGMGQFQWFKNCMKDGVAATKAAAGK